MKGIQLKNEREKREWTQTYLAQKTGVSKQAVCNWENGRSIPRHDTILILENMFNMSHRELFATVDDENSFSINNNG